MALAKAERLKLNRDFARIYRRGKYYKGKWIGLHTMDRRGKFRSEPARVGFTVSRAVRGAVARNRAKRLMREAFRLRNVELRPGIDLIMTGRWRPDKEPPLASIIEETDRLLVAAGVSRSASTSKS